MSHSWSNAGVHMNCKSLNCESNNNCQCTIVYYEPQIEWNWIYDHTVNRGFMHMQFSFGAVATK